MFSGKNDSQLDQIFTLVNWKDALQTVDALVYHATKDVPFQGGLLYKDLIEPIVRMTDDAQANSGCDHYRFNVMATALMAWAYPHGIAGQVDFFGVTVGENVRALQTDDLEKILELTAGLQTLYGIYMLRRLQCEVNEEILRHASMVADQLMLPRYLKMAIEIAVSLLTR